MDAFLYRIKAAQRDLIERCGGIMRVESLTGYSKSQVGRWNNPSEPDQMPVGAIRSLERDCGVALVTAVLAEANGRRLTDPEAERAGDVSILSSLGSVGSEFGEMMNAAAMAISDGHVTPSEATTVDRIASQLERSLSHLRASLASAKAAGGERATLSVVGRE